MAQANQDPSTIGPTMAKVVNFTTTNLSSGDPFVEPHTVSGPTGSYNVPVSVINIGNGKFVIPLTSDTSAGANYLKLHLPQPNSSDFYVTFCVKNNSLQDGYYDYTTGIPADYRADFRTFCLDGTISIPSQNTPFSKTLVFQVLGLYTNISSAAVQYTVELSAVFGGATPPPSSSS